MNATSPPALVILLLLLPWQSRYLCGTITITIATGSRGKPAASSIESPFVLCNLQQLSVMEGVGEQSAFNVSPACVSTSPWTLHSSTGARIDDV